MSAAPCIAAFRPQRAEGSWLGPTGPASAAQSESAMKIRVTCLDICPLLVLPGSAEPDRNGTTFEYNPESLKRLHLADQVRKLGMMSFPGPVGRHWASPAARRARAPDHPTLRRRRAWPRADLLDESMRKSSPEAGEPLVEEPSNASKSESRLRDAVPPVRMNASNEGEAQPDGSPR